MKDHWVIRYDGWICGEWETTWEGHSDLHSAIQHLIRLSKDGWRNVFLEYDPDPEEYEE
jgi:hypothetical protein